MVEENRGNRNPGSFWGLCVMSRICHHASTWADLGWATRKPHRIATMNVSSNNNAAATNPAADTEIFDVPVAAIHASRSSRSNGWSKVKKVLPDVVAVRSSFQGKMAVSGSRQKEKFAKRGSDVPPADPGDLEKNFDSVSTLGAPSGFHDSNSDGFQHAGAWKSKRSNAEEDGEDSAVRREKDINKRRENIRADRSSRMSMTIADLANNRRTDGRSGRAERVEKAEPKVERSRHTGTKMFGRNELIRRIREGMEMSSSSSDKDSDTIGALKSVIVNLKQKLQRETEKVVRLEVELEVANETIRKMSKEDGGMEGGEFDRNGILEGSTAAYDLYVLKSRIKDLEEKNKTLKKQLIEHLSA